MRPSQRGFTLIELILVLVIAGMLLSISLPKLTRSSGDLARRSARHEIAAALTQARSQAVQTGRWTKLAWSGNVITVVVDPDGSAQTIERRDLGAQYGITLSSSSKDLTDIRFDPRGLRVRNKADDPWIVSLVAMRDGKRDSVCVIGRGKIASGSCTLTP